MTRLASRVGASIAFHRVMLVLALFSLWELAARLRWLDPDFVSPPSAVFQALVELAGNSRLHAATAVTLQQVAYAYAAAAVVAIGLGFGVGLSSFAYRTFEPIILLLFSLPKMVLLPLFILFFGIGIVSKSVFAFSLGVFPILLNVIAGARMVDRTLIDSARSMGASQLDLFRKVVFPAALPSIVTGLRLGMTQTVLGVLLAELYGASTGLGYYVQLYTQGFKSAHVFALFFVVATFAILVNEVLRTLEERAGRWRENGVGGVAA